MAAHNLSEKHCLNMTKTLLSKYHTKTCLIEIALISKVFLIKHNLVNFNFFSSKMSRNLLFHMLEKECFTYTYNSIINSGDKIFKKIGFKYHKFLSSKQFSQNCTSISSKNLLLQLFSVNIGYIESAIRKRNLKNYF